MHRDTPLAFAGDERARACAQEAIDTEADRLLSVDERIFVYMPFMHSERLADHDLAQRLFAVPGMERQQDYEARHRAVIERFGRYPHRNAILGRDSTPAELEYLARPDAGF